MVKFASLFRCVESSKGLESFFCLEIVDKLGAHKGVALVVKRVAIGEIDGSDVVDFDGDFVFRFNGAEWCSFDDLVNDVDRVVR